MTPTTKDPHYADIMDSLDYEEFWHAYDDLVDAESTYNPDSDDSLNPVPHPCVDDERDEDPLTDEEAALVKDLVGLYKCRLSSGEIFRMDIRDRYHNGLLDIWTGVYPSETDPDDEDVWVPGYGTITIDTKTGGAIVNGFTSSDIESSEPSQWADMDISWVERGRSIDVKCDDRPVTKTIRVTLAETGKRSEPESTLVMFEEDGRR